jgi:hypothetical protein
MSELSSPNPADLAASPLQAEGPAKDPSAICGAALCGMGLRGVKSPTSMLPEVLCAQVLPAFTITLPLGSYPRGSYLVWVNGDQIGNFDSEITLENHVTFIRSNDKNMYGSLKE